MKEKYFLINEIAKLHNVSKKTLLYYDRIGLFQPYEVDPESGYRYYIRQQFPYLKQIIYLKDLDFTLDEIKVLLEDRRFDPLLHKIHEKIDDVEIQINRLVSRRDDLRYLQEFYEMAKSIDERDLYRPNIRFMPERYVVYELCEHENSKAEVMLTYRKILRNMINLSIISQMSYGTFVSEPKDETMKYYDEIGAFVQIPERQGTGREHLLPAGKYATMYKKGGYYDPKSCEMLLEWCHENNYKVEGPMFDFSLVDYTFTKDEDEMIQEIQIKIS